jgi:hypothetical protein
MNAIPVTGQGGPIASCEARTSSSHRKVKGTFYSGTDGCVIYRALIEILEEYATSIFRVEMKRCSLVYSDYGS